MKANKEQNNTTTITYTFWINNKKKTINKSLYIK